LSALRARGTLGRMTLRASYLLSLGLILCVGASACQSDGDGDEADEGNGAADDPNRLRNPDDDDDDPSTLAPLGGRSSMSTEDAGGVPIDGSTEDAGNQDAGSADSSPADAGGSDDPPDAAPAGCQNDLLRCTSAGRERCEDGDWVSDPCPLDEPACVSGRCELRGPTMVKVGSFYIDSTEVTVADYVAFLDAKGDDTSGQPQVCSWNTSFYDDTPVDPDNWPITWVDWCDAHAYCDWAGKRLCGAIEGGAVAEAAVLDQTVSQWFLACGGSYGSSHPNANADCNSTGGNGGLAAVGSHAECEGFYPGLFDMEGNAAEWVDSCRAESGATDICMLVGGSHIDNQSYCTEYFDEFERDTTAGPFGFRCCSG
jgi:formylglycine-generating enzyme